MKGLLKGIAENTEIFSQMNFLQHHQVRISHRVPSLFQRPFPLLRRAPSPEDVLFPPFS